MSGKLIIIRGNSGSGKSTVATKLRRTMGYKTMLIPQDIIRREIVRVADEMNNPAIQLMQDIAIYGNRLDYDVIIEGILNTDKYARMLKELSGMFNETYTYYFDISFEETVKRHQTKDKKKEFGSQEMKAWWVEKDYLGFEDEKVITAAMSEIDIVHMILNDIA